MKSAQIPKDKTVQGKYKAGKDSSSLTRPFKIPRLKQIAKTSKEQVEKEITDKINKHHIEPVQTLQTNEDEVKEHNEPVSAPVGEKAIGEKIARDFGELGVFCGYVYKVETERGRHYYNVKYEDEDMEEWDESQYIFGRELRQSFDTGQYNPISEDREKDGDLSSGGESTYSADREERELQKKKRRRKKKTPKQSKTIDAEEAVTSIGGKQTMMGETDLPNKKQRRSKQTPKKFETIDAEAVTRLGGKKSMMGATFQKLTPTSQDKVCADMQKPVAQAVRKKMKEVKNDMTCMCLYLCS